MRSKGLRGSTMKIWMALIVLATLLSAGSVAQTGPTASSAQSAPAATPSDSDEEPDVPVAKGTGATDTSVEAQTNAAWDMLNTALSDTKTQAEQARIDAIAALGTLGDFPRAVGLLRDAEKDQNRYIRLAAVAAIGSSKKTIFVPDLKQALNDSAPEVSFTAAVGLWKMKDRSGEDVLEAVFAGDRKANRDLVNSEKHEAGQDLHSSSKLAAIGAEQGAYAVLGPFGFGLSALRHKGDNGIHPKVLAATLLAEDTSTASMKKFIDALDDPDPLVRTAAAKALGDYHSKEAMDALNDTFYDIKPAVRFMAAASYIRAAHPQPEKKEVQRRKGSTSTKSTHQQSAIPRANRGVDGRSHSQAPA
jgi:HEAT repeats